MKAHFTILLFFAINLLTATCFGQCMPSESEGYLTDTTQLTRIHYTVDLTGDAVWGAVGPIEEHCGISSLYGGFRAWTNNTGNLATITYNFDIPLVSIDVILDEVGINGFIRPETFVFETNTNGSVLQVNSGTCAPWTVAGDTINSPAIMDAINAIVTVSSDTPFNHLTITSGENSGINGGTFVALCTASAVIKKCTGLKPAISAIPARFCTQDTGTICCTPGYPSYKWSNGLTDTNCMQLVNQTGFNLYVTVTDNNGCTAVSDGFTIPTYPVATVSISVNGDTLKAYGGTYYQWYIYDEPILAATDSILVTVQSGPYSVLVTDSNGCTGLSNHINFTRTDINETNNETFSISPNPANTELKLNTGKLPVKQVSIYNATGQLVSVINSPINSTINVNDLSSGVYLIQLELTGNSRENVVRRFVKM